MKKIYLLILSLFACILVRAQVTTVIYASGAMGSYTTGSVIENIPVGSPATYTRSDGIIAVANNSATVQRGYAVFDLSSIPSTATVSRVSLGFYVFGTTGATTSFTNCNTFGYAGDLSTVTSATVCMAAMTSGTSLWTSGTAYSPVGTGSYWSTGTLGTGTDSAVSFSPLMSPYPTTACTFVQSHLGTKISMCFTQSVSGANVYNIDGETSSAIPDEAIVGPHAPFLEITYCYIPTGVTATAFPNPVCDGDTLKLHGTAVGASSYKWTGPSGFTSISIDTSLVVGAGSAGTYFLTAYANCGVSTVNTTVATPNVTISASPAALITTTTTVCTGNTIYISDITPGGVWSSSNTSVATITSTGQISSVSGGITVISYTLGNCPKKDTVWVNDPPTTITGPTDVCESGGQITLVNGSAGGTWSSSSTSNATVDPSTGLVTGVANGSTTISYVTGACPTVTKPITVDPLPTTILGPTAVCVNATQHLSDATANGTWTSSNTSVATVVASTGVVTGASAGTATISYVLPTGCYITMVMTVNPIPQPITGPSAVCIGQNISLSDPTATGTWSSGNIPVATVVPATGVVWGATTAGVAPISYILPVTGCFVTHSVTVNPLPDPIAGPTAVCAASVITLSDDVSGGGWTSQTTTVATVDAVTGDVTGVAGGTSNVTYTLSSTGCFITTGITVNPLPTASITASGPTTFCTGGSVTLNAATGAGYNYQWYSGSTPVGTNSPTYVSNSTELVTVQVTDGNNCVNTSAGVQVTLIPNAVITAGGPTVFCQTGNVVLSVPLAPGILYQWKLNGTSIAGANASTYAATLDGVYTCDLVVPGGCAATTPGFTVTVHPLPVPVVTRAGSMLVTTNGYLTYLWFLNSVAIPGATTDTTAITVNGSYRVRVTDGNGCTGYSSAYIINSLGVQQINNADIRIYPNPAKSTVHVDAPVSVRAVISGIDGKTILEAQDAHEINISSLSEGIYMITLYNDAGDKLLVQKLVKE